MQPTSRYPKLIVMDAVHNEQPKKASTIQTIYPLHDFYVCSVIQLLQVLLHDKIPFSSNKTQDIFLCIIKLLLRCEYVYKAGNKKPQATLCRAFVRVIKSYLIKCILNQFLGN